MDEFAGVRLLAEVKVRCNGVLEEMDHKISEQKKERRVFGGNSQAFRKHLQECGGQHESGADGHEVAKIAALPMALNDDQPANSVSQSSGESENNGEHERRHIVWIRSRTMADMHHVAILNDVLFAL